MGRVAPRYQEATNESEVREYEKVRRQFMKQLCGDNKKPTGRGRPSEQTERALLIKQRIVDKLSAGKL